MQTLRSVLACTMVITIASAVQGQLVAFGYEKYTRFLTSLILLSLLVQPLISLMHLSEDFSDETIEKIQVEEVEPTDCLFQIFQNRLAYDLSRLIQSEWGISEELICVESQVNGVDLSDVRVVALRIVIAQELSENSSLCEEIEKKCLERYGCETVSVTAVA